jgi:hypothetical protein
MLLRRKLVRRSGQPAHPEIDLRARSAGVEDVVMAPNDRFKGS